MGFSESSSAPLRLEIHLEAQLHGLGLPHASPLLVAFSGGTDSLALLIAANRLRASQGLDLHACHVDHGLDPSSESRAARAAEMASSFGLEPGIRFHSLRLNARPERGQSIEAWARNQRYRSLTQLADSLGGAWLATAHHADDQAETLLLRLLYGTGIAGLAGIRARRGIIVRPFLGLSRAELQRAVALEGLTPTQDPTNDDLSLPRNRIRRQILPEWKKQNPNLVMQIGKVAVAVDRTVGRIKERMIKEAEIRPLTKTRGSELRRSALVGLPIELQSHMLSALSEVAGKQYPASTKARRELFRQLETRRGKISCDAGAGWRWYGDSLVLRLLPPSTQPLPNFTYTLMAPGSVKLAEIGFRATIRRGVFASWMLKAHPARAGFSLEGASATRNAEHCFEIRNRRLGDRIRPLGASRPKKLKDLLIEKRIPREQREDLPLVISEGHLIWVPGVALDERYRATPGAADVWIVELQSLDQKAQDSERCFAK